MLITRRDPCTGFINSMDIPVTKDQMDEYENPFRKKHVQDIFPNLDAGKREFIMTGIMPESWDELWEDEDQENEGTPFEFKSWDIADQ